jgi:membrane-bound lytic murein transglycosylase D
MLKKNLVKAGFFGHGAVFLMVSPFTLNLSKEKTAHLNDIETPQIVTVLKDTGDLKRDTVMFARVTELMQSPRIQLNASASAYVKKFLKKNTEELEATEKRSDKYFDIIEKVFGQYNLPPELKYLAVVESQLKTSALSHAGARGPWQLMAQTGRDFGLKVNGKTDERTHFYKSTVAAAKYLKALHNEFGDWLLVLAAYNGGSGTVLKAIKKSGSRNFWRLQQFLPAETRGHVKRFIGTHCYFQQELSLTVLTSAETKAYLQEVVKWKENQVQSSPDSLIAIR